MTDDFLSKFPIKLHPDKEMMTHFVTLFIENNPSSFEQLVRLLKEKKDLIVVMNDFIDFIYQNGFDKKYNEYSIFGELQRIAALRINDNR